MQPTLRQVPPRASSPFAFFQPSMHAVFRPSCAARTAAMYPPGPEPMTTTSNVCAMGMSVLLSRCVRGLLEPDPRDVHAHPGAEACGEGVDILQEHRRMLQEPQ